MTIKLRWDKLDLEIKKLYQEKVDNMKWSFSRINSFEHGCQFCWFQNYIIKERGGGNAFSDYGSLMHEILEKYFKGELMAWELEDVFDKGFIDNVGSFPPNKFVDLRVSYYNQGIKYLQEFDGLPDYEMLEIEPAISVDIDGYEFIGFIDLLARNKNNGKLVVIDHKSKAEFKTKEELREYGHQLYLYAIWVHKKYGEYPSLLKFNMFRKQTEKTIIFKEKDLEASRQWMLDSIQRIRNCEIFSVTSDDFFGTQLCNNRDHILHSLGASYSLEQLWEG